MEESAAAAVSFDDAVEPLYRQTRAALTQPPSQSGALLLVISIALFLATQLGDGASAANVAIVVGVLFFHESGHWLGMRLTGYRDVKMFFIPFFGAAVSGKRAGVAAWKEALVLLLGPLPGLLAGAVVLVVAIVKGDPIWRQLAIVLLLVNGFNLLPLGFLDGGKLFHRVLFSRQRHVEVLFAILAGAGLILVALALHMWLLALFGLFALTAIPRRWQLLAALVRLRRERGAIGADVTLLDDAESRAIFLAARDALPASWRARPILIARAMEDLVEAARPAPGAGATVLLLAGWIFGLFLSLVALSVIASAHGRHWQRVTEPQAHFSVELAGPPAHVRMLEQTPAGAKLVQTLRDQRDLLKKFTVEWIDLPSPPAADWIDRRRDLMARTLGAQVVQDHPLAQSGVDGRELVYSSGSRVWQARLFVVGPRVYELWFSAPTQDVEGLRFLDSFRLEP